MTPASYRQRGKAASCGIFFTQFVPDHLVYLLEGAGVTLELCFVSMALGIAIGVVSAILAIAGGRVMKGFVRIYVSICRGVPLIVILLFVYFTLPEVGFRLPAFWAGVLGLSVNLGAYLSEVFRAAILAVDAGQTQAGLSLGLRRVQIYRKIILPQAAIIAVPTVGGYFISLLKDCALVSFISVDELLRHGTYIISATFRSMETYMLVGAIYYVMSVVAAHLIRGLETRLRPAYLGCEVAMSRVKVGLIGCGFIAELHMQAYRRVYGVNVEVAAVSARGDQVVDFAKRHRIAATHRDYRALIADKTIDVIDICTPPALHGAMIVESMEAGKHVICEKPFAGYFGRAGDPEPIGKRVAKSAMYQRVLEEMDGDRRYRAPQRPAVHVCRGLDLCAGGDEDGGDRAGEQGQDPVDEGGGEP